MNTMLLGGLWHGASWNFMIWGGLNGLGILVYKFWRNKSALFRTLILAIVLLLFFLLWLLFHTPVFSIGLVWVSILFAGTLIRLLYSLSGGIYRFTHLATCWAVAQTFVFITFTRLFFRAGSNLNPVEANQTAWNTARNMVNQIGGHWNFSQIGDMVYEYRSVFSFIAIGMIIHWLPDKWKRRYRLAFARLPLALMALLFVLCIFIVFQFVTADLQAFIYFQF
jgi:D-alanyl-lipoteichoic acid acyltransferase DltB (MBOAT superfamily)